MSELDEDSVYPKPIERQRVSTCLKVFSEKTIVSLEDYGKVKSVDVSGTVLFLTKVHRLWTICNVRQKNVNLRKRRPLQAVVTDPMDERLNYLQEFGDMCFKMSGKQEKRNSKLSKDTAVSMKPYLLWIVWFIEASTSRRKLRIRLPWNVLNWSSREGFH